MRKDLTNQKFGKLTAICFDRVVNKRAKWLCKCDCGKEKSVFVSNLTGGRSLSCGCLIGKSNIKPNSHYAKNAVLQYYKQNAKKRKIEFQLSLEEFIDLVSKNCYYCNRSPSVLKKVNTGEFLHHGIDRFDNSLGYIKSNCVPCCRICNQAKSTLTVDEFKSWIKDIYTEFYIEG